MIRAFKQKFTGRNIAALMVIMLFCLSFLLAPNVRAATLDVQFQNEPKPLFQDGDAKPCDTTTRWIRVSNLSNAVQPVAIQASNFTNPVPADDLSRALSIVIKQGATELYGGSANPKTLYDFYQAGAITLPDIGVGVINQYDITISFPCEKVNEWQQKTTGFDVDIHFQGETPQANGGGGGGGSFLSTFSVSTTSPRILGEKLEPILNLTKTISKSTARPGDKNIRFTLSLANSGSAPAINVQVRDVLPEGLIFSDDGAKIKTWNLGDLEVGANRELAYLVNVTAEAPTGKYINNAEAWADNHQKLTASAVINVTEPSILGIKLSDTGFSNAEFSYLIMSLLALFGIRAFLKKPL